MFVFFSLEIFSKGIFCIPRKKLSDGETEKMVVRKSDVCPRRVTMHGCVDCAQS